MADRPVLTLIDASGFIFRAYHAIQHLSTSKGVSTNAVYGFTRMVLKTLREFNPTHVALAFDKESRKGRQAIDPTYKANREGPPPDLIPQFALIRQVVEALNLPVLEFEGWEADDVVGTMAMRAKEAGFDVFVITGDKDFVQLIDDHVKLYDPMQERHMGEKEAVEKYGVQPNQMRDYLALVGDAIDNVAKVPGIGPKTAVELLGQFGNVENLVKNLDQVKKPKVRESLQTHLEQLQRALQLVSFRLDLPIEVSIDDLARRPIHEAQARDLFSELEFFKLLQEMPQQEPTPLASQTEVVGDRAALEKLAATIRETKSVALIPAFEGLPHQSELTGIGVGLPDGKTFYIPLAHRYLGAPTNIPTAVFREVFGPVMSDPSIKKDGHDLKALALLLDGIGVRLAGAHGDAELLSYLLNPSRREHALMDLTRERLRCELPPIPGGIVPKKKDARVWEVSVEQAATIFGSCADAARRLALELWQELERVGLAKLAVEVELPLIPILGRMERAGVKLDKATLKEISDRVGAQAEIQLSEIHRLAGKEFNVNSNRELCEVLFTELKLPVLKRGKTGPSTDSEVLEKLAEQHPMPKAILEYRSLTKLKSTYLDTLPDQTSRDSRLHTTFHQAAAATGRLSSSDPNLQNIPIRTEMGAEIRKAFVAEEGHELISADYSQIELRLLAHVAGDPGLIEAFTTDQDVHTRTAAEVFGVPPSEVTREQRSAAKMVNFGIAYGLSPHGLSARLGIPREEAASIIDRYFQRYGGIRSYLDETVEKAKKFGFVETLFGRRRYIPDIQSRNKMAAMAAERAAINMPIQGTAADLIKMAMIKADEQLAKEKLSARMLLQVHDELLFEAPMSEVARVVELARECMSSVASFKVPLKVEVGHGKNWAEAH
ncbi:MAG: DNA polymerase I [Myxococcaceae bacterium]